MIVTLTGPNGFALQSALQQLVAAFVAEHGNLAVERLDGEETEFGRLQEALTSLPFLATKKMAVLRRPDANKQFSERFEQLFAEVPETTEVILVEPKLDKRLSYYKFLKRRTDFREFPEHDTNGLARWLVDSAKQQGGSLSVGDARYLVDRSGTNQQSLRNELDKLLLYNVHITRQTIDLLTDPTPQSTIFQLLEAAFGGNTRLAMNLYREQRALKVEPAQIVAMLAWQLHVLAIIKTAGDRSADQIAKEAKLNPYVVRKSQGITRKLTLPNLKALIADLLSLDTRSKREAIDLDDGLQNYLLLLALKP
jgi:DNA polymerase III delta subunit